MNIIVPTKQVPDLVEDLVIDDSGKALDPDEIDTKLNEFDEHALEEAICLKEASGGTVTVVSLDGEGVDKMLYTALAKGADRAIKLVGPEPEDIDGNYAKAALFAGALGDLGADLVLTGVQACDDRDGQFGPLLAALLGMPSISVVTGLEAAGSTVKLTKEYSGGLTAKFEVDLPAVVGVQAARQTPRYVPVSKVRQVQQSASIEEIEVEDDGKALSSILEMSPPETGEGAKMLANAEALLEVLREKGAVS